MEHQPAQVLEGTVEAIIFYNEDNGFTVMEVEAADG